MSHAATARRVEVPLLPALGLSAATGGALAALVVITWLARLAL